MIAATVVLFWLNKGLNSTPVPVSSIKWQMMTLMLLPASAVSLIVSAWTGGIEPASQVNGAASIAVETPASGSLQGEEFEASGKLLSSLGSGQVLFAAVGKIGENGREPDLYYLQPGPCAVIEKGTRWKCWPIRIGGDDKSQWNVVVFGAAGSRPADLVERLLAGPAYEQARATDPSARDPRNMTSLPVDAVELARTMITLKSGR